METTKPKKTPEIRPVNRYHNCTCYISISFSHKDCCTDKSIQTEMPQAVVSITIQSDNVGKWCCTSSQASVTKGTARLNWYMFDCSSNRWNRLTSYNGRPFPQNCPFPWGSEPPRKTRFFGPIGAHRPNGISVGSAIFPQMTVECPYTLQWDAHSPPKICPFPWGDLNPYLIHGPLGPPQSSTQTASRSVQPFLQDSLAWQTDRPTDHATRSLTIDRIYVRSTAMRSKNEMALQRAEMRMVRWICNVKVKDRVASKELTRNR